ncbi:MAG: repressor LexA, partial [Selenomonadaceae bacterium]|nr:repressor LexA [Selenomonadaceae bacterium]
AVGTVKSNVSKYLVEMEQLGMIRRDKRNIIVHSKVQSSPKLNRVPILGNISCGTPEYAEENYEEYVPLPAALFGEGEFFILRARGTSMIEAGIDPGDLVVVRKQQSADVGDIIVALVDNETPLKRFYIDKDKKCVRLHPENKTMKDILVNSCYIQGVAQHVIKAL